MAVGKPGIGYGSSVKYGDSNGGASSTYTPVGKLVDLNPAIGLEADSIETTTQDSPNRAKTFMPGLFDAGSIQLDLVLVEGETTQAQLAADLKAGTVRDFQVIKPGGHGWECEAFVQTFQENVPLGDKMGISVTVKWSGNPVPIVP